MQVAPMNPKLKPPGIERLKLSYDKLLSTSAFKVNLRRYLEDLLRDSDALGKAVPVCPIKTHVESAWN